MSTLTDRYALAHETATAFNRTHGGEFLQVAERSPELLTFDEIRNVATTQPGEYVVTGLFQAVKGRRPTRSEAIRLGHALGHLRIARRKSGPYTLWLLDKAFAQRSH
ncbi:hypothetical protein KEM14_gp39 [Xanthomonas virus phiXaf18]|uniref:Uncharacterized protein n=1 Tax=Xanthomonas virus phiXaf18 TaxID=2653651 RepID=A0A5P8PQJ5_9CAUD|nr:hypothetical protein KEM14_gp39 [Xanthomonas virus phiXaf18]QFR59547.1 hypothetical protein phiXaf18_39 [Xanthomonas virus phiXaf18]UGL62920.1 hypothetical protein [Xanthomonas phage MYK3]UUW40429.1 hypothetical protein [Xanthomonas phage BsXeu269p/3]